MVKLLIRGAQAQTAVHNAQMSLINPFICHDEQTLNRGSIRNIYWNRLPLVEANVAIDFVMKAIFGALSSEMKKGVVSNRFQSDVSTKFTSSFGFIRQEQHILFIADAYSALKALQNANNTDAYYTKSFTMTDVARVNAQLSQQNITVDDINDIEDALSIIATGATDMEKNRGYVRCSGRVLTRTLIKSIRSLLYFSSDSSNC